MLNNKRSAKNTHSKFSIQNSVFSVAFAAAGSGVDIGNEFLFQGNASAQSAFPNVSTFIATILPNVYVVAGLVLFFLVLLGGFFTITGAGDEEKIKRGHMILTSAILGFAIVFGSFWLIQIIQILTGVPILKGF